MASKKEELLKAKRAESDNKKPKEIDAVTNAIMHPEQKKEDSKVDIKTKRVSLIMDEELFNQLEARCKEVRMTKNGYVNRLLAKDLLKIEI